MSTSFMAGARTYTDVALKTTALSPPKSMQNETERKCPEKKGCEEQRVSDGNVGSVAPADAK